jgi:hypothetical protein
MEISTRFLKYLNNLNATGTLYGHAYISWSNTACVEALSDTLTMFAPNDVHVKTLFCDQTQVGSKQTILLSSIELMDLVCACLNLDEAFQETDYLKYIVRKVFARYQKEGKIIIETVIIEYDKIVN